MKKPRQVIAPLLVLSALLCLAACKDGWEAEPYDYRHGDSAGYTTKKQARDRALDGMIFRRNIVLPE